MEPATRPSSPPPPPARDALSTPAFPPTAAAPTAGLPPHLALTALTPATLPSFRRLVALLLPIRYPDRFYQALLANPDGLSVARVAVWDDPPPHATSIRRAPATAKPSAGPLVVGGIACRLEPLEPPTTNGTADADADAGDGAPVEYALYVQTLAVLSAFRGQGVGTALLEAAVAAAMGGREGKDAGVARRVLRVYAHVWEANAEALAWYRARGFAVEDGVVPGYYRRLTPGGARVVSRGTVGMVLGSGAEGAGKGVEG